MAHANMVENDIASIALLCDLVKQTTRIRRCGNRYGPSVPNHKSKCRHFHGHRYRFEAEIEGDIVETTGVSEEGMLMDFSDVSHILTVHIHDVVDHALLCTKAMKKPVTLSGLSSEHRTVVVPFIPTAENLANGRTNKCNHTFRLRMEIIATCSYASVKPEKLGIMVRMITLLQDDPPAPSGFPFTVSLQIQERLMHRRNLQSIGLFDLFQVPSVAMRVSECEGFRRSSPPVEIWQYLEWFTENFPLLW